MITLYCHLPGNTNWRIASFCLRVLLLLAVCYYYKVGPTLSPYLLVTHVSIHNYIRNHFFTYSLAVNKYFSYDNDPQVIA